MTGSAERVYDQFGEPAVLSLQDRGLAYGDGLFETMRIHQGEIPLLERHVGRLADGLQRLGMPTLPADTLRQRARAWAGGRAEGVLKLVVTRGAGGRGYLPPDQAEVRLLVFLHELPAPLGINDGLRLGTPSMPLATSPLLAGLKHLNRLEQVMARREMSLQGFDEGLMFDVSGCLVEAVAANVMLVRDGRVLVPGQCGAGVSGVMLGWCLDWCRANGISVVPARLTRADIHASDELLLCNAIRGVMPASAWEGRQWSARRFAGLFDRAIQEGLAGF